MNPVINGLKLAIKIGIGHNANLLALTPQQLLEAINPESFTDIFESPTRQQPKDANHIIDNLQECLNNLLDARKRLIALGLYELRVDYEEKGIATKQAVQVNPREEIPEVLEDDQHPYSDSEEIPPNPFMEI